MQVIEQYSNYNHYDYNNPKYVVIHYVGAQSSTAKNNADYFCGGDRQASAHEFVDDDYCYKVIKESQGAWHVGNTMTDVNNQNSIGIEMCCMGANLTVTEKTEANTVERVVYYLKKYNIPISNLRTHYEVSGGTKICPNWSNDNWSRYNNFKAKVQKALNGTTGGTSDVGILYRVKRTNGEQIGAFKSLDNAKALAQTNKCNVYRSSDNALIVSYASSESNSNTTVNYRVKRKNGEQLGAFNSLDNAKTLAQNENAIVYDNLGNIVVSYVATANLGFVNLKPHMQSWRVYAVDGPYTLDYAVGSLSPAFYGGLSYEILEKKETDVYKIKTQTYGVVAIYVPVDNDSSFTSTPVY